MRIDISVMSSSENKKTPVLHIGSPSSLNRTSKSEKRIGCRQEEKGKCGTQTYLSVHACMLLYVYMYICIYVYIYTYVCLCVYAHVEMWRYLTSMPTHFNSAEFCIFFSSSGTPWLFPWSNWIITCKYLNDVRTFDIHNLIFFT